MPEARAFPEDRLAFMLEEMRGVKVEELDHQDYQSLLRVMGILIEGVTTLAKRGPSTGPARKILADAAARAARDQLPMPATDTEPTRTTDPR